MDILFFLQHKIRLANLTRYLLLALLLNPLLVTHANDIASQKNIKQSIEEIRAELEIATTKKELKKQFKIAYGNFKKSAQTNASDKASIQQRLVYAEQAYQLGKKYYGEQHKNSNNLAYSLANTYNVASEVQNFYIKERNWLKNQANNLLLPLEAFYLNTYGEHHMILVDFYSELAKSLETNSKYQVKMKKEYYQKALSVSAYNAANNPALNARIQMEISAALLGLGKGSGKEILAARDYYKAHQESEYDQLISANLLAGNYYFYNNQTEDAITIWEESLSLFNKEKSFTHPYELVTHSRLVYAYEEEGDSDKATKHCIAIGAMQPWDDSQQPVPLFRIRPKYPLQQARDSQEGSVVLSFTITTSGQVENIELIEWQGSREFVKPAKKALAKWRYAPKFDQGKAVEASVTVSLDFVISS